MSMYATSSFSEFKGPGLFDRWRNIAHPLRWFRRRMLRKPGSTLAMSLAALLGGVIMTNALALQTERHPAPMFTSLVADPVAQPAAVPAPPVRPQVAERKPVDAASQAVAAAGKPAKGLPREVEAPVLAPAARAATPKDQMLAIIRNGAPEPVVDNSQRTLLVQKALNRAGYGPLKEDGAFGAGTRQALEKFEADRKLPVRGEATGRTARELTRASGVSFE